MLLRFRLNTVLLYSILKLYALNLGNHLIFFLQVTLNRSHRSLLNKTIFNKKDKLIYIFRLVLFLILLVQALLWILFFLLSFGGASASPLHLLLGIILFLRIWLFLSHLRLQLFGLRTWFPSSLFLAWGFFFLHFFLFLDLLRDTFFLLFSCFSFALSSGLFDWFVLNLLLAARLPHGFLFLLYY